MCLERMTDIERNSILDAIDVLNDLVNDLVAGTMVFANYQSRFAMGEFSQPGIVAVQKMCVSHLILGLNKLCEFWEVFHRLVPAELRPEMKALVSELQRRGIKEFRNTVVAHVWDRKRRRTRTQSEVIAQLNQISAGNPADFLLWLNNPNDNAYPKTVVSIVQALRNHLREQHGVNADEIFQR
ncbi:MAG: hypothetical protein A2X56_07315 [Nitrospirae bacterium GWC2_57_13]|nr:MAG: hypothetical protein A2X56_07315 [Nitrospirae bacterium GWC2_57_13]